MCNCGASDRRGRTVGDRPRRVRGVGERGVLSWVFVVVVCVKSGLPEGLSCTTSPKRIPPSRS